MDNITYGHNGAEVERQTVYVGHTTEGQYVHHAPEPLRSDLVYVEQDEFVCLGCNTVVDGPEGHEQWECLEASRDRAEDM